jgi:rhomboid protease GluP
MDDMQQMGEDEAFFPSESCPLRTIRRTIWIGTVLGMAVGFYGSRGNPGVGVLLSVFLLVVAILIDWFLRKPLRPGVPVVELTSETIESCMFDSSAKPLRWEEIADVAVTSGNGAARVVFKLKPPNGRWRVCDKLLPRRRSLVLSPFSPDVQETVVGAILRRFQLASGKSGEALPLDNPLSGKREFVTWLNSLAPTIWVTHTLVAVNVAVWLAMLWSGVDLFSVPADLLLIWGANAASEVQRGQWWRLLSSMFLHGGLVHVAMNMIGLISLGSLVERIYGHRLFALLYLCSGLAGSALSLHYSAQRSVSVGASGAIFGIAGALIVAVVQHRHRLPKAFSQEVTGGTAVFVLYSLVQGVTHKGIDNSAHMGGLVMGCLLGWLLPERFDSEHFRKTWIARSAIALLVASGATIALAALAPPAAVDFQQEIALKRGFLEFQAAMVSIQSDYKEVKEGKLSEGEANRRGRDIHAPTLKHVADDLRKLELDSADARRSMLADTVRACDLMAEALTMPPTSNAATGKVQSANPQRLSEIESELTALNVRMKQYAEALKKAAESDRN